MSSYLTRIRGAHRLTILVILINRNIWGPTVLYDILYMYIIRIRREDLDLQEVSYVLEDESIRLIRLTRSFLCFGRVPGENTRLARRTRLIRLMRVSMCWGEWEYKTYKTVKNIRLGGPGPCCMIRVALDIMCRIRILFTFVCFALSLASPTRLLFPDLRLLGVLW